MEEKSPSIQELFKEKCVLITGATGFLGKVLLEKLTRSCTDIEAIYVLLRPNKEGSLDERHEKLINHRIFDRIRSSAPDLLQKIRPLKGDVTIDDLGLSEKDLETVRNEVQFVFHCAANVRFDGEAKRILEINLVGVKNVLNVCLACSKLEAVVHTSTAFCCCQYKYIQELVYPEVSPRRLLDVTGWMENDQLRVLCSFFLQKRPSLYPFSKALGETLIDNEYSSLPVIIVRPSVVTASVNEPYPGWIDNYNGPSGFIAVCGKGIVRTLLVLPDINADWVPVDIVANTLIVAAHYIAVKRKQPNSPKLTVPCKVPVINCTCPEENIKTWMELINLCLPYLVKYPSSEIYRKPGGAATNCILQYSARKLYAHYIPALLVDTGLFLMRKKPRIMKMYATIHRVMSHLEYYTTNSFRFESSNMHCLVTQMDPVDREIFPIDQRKMDWNKYIEGYVLGVRRHFLMESDDTLPYARKRMVRMNIIWIMFKMASLIGLFMLVKRLYYKRSGLLYYFPRIPVSLIAAFILEKLKLQRK